MSMPATGAPGTVPAVPKPRPYRRYLTSALHTRFVHAVLLSLFNSLFIAFWTGKDYFWSWFPFGPAGLKALLFTMSSLFIFILQLSTMNVGRRTSRNLTAAIRSFLFDPSTYQTFFWYIVSAWWFCEAYIWAVPEGYDMGWVTRGSLSGPDRLNERPIYLRFFFTVIAIVQSCMHLYYGQSFLHIPVAPLATPQAIDQQTHPIDSVQIQLQRKLPLIGIRASLASGLATVTAPFIYRAFFRDFFWRMHLLFAKPFFNITRSDANPPNKYFIGVILGWAFVVGVLMSFMWEMAAYSFLVYLKQAPLKNNLPLSAGSKDPNGSLLNGLRAKRSVVKTFAFWELALIAQKYPDRRKAIFADFERPDGPMWTSMIRALLTAVSDIDTRILALNPSPPQTAAPSQQEQINSLPRITKNANNASIVAPISSTTRTQKVERFIAQANKALGTTQNPWSPPIQKTQQKLLEYAKNSAGSEGQELQKSVTAAFKTSSVGGFLNTNPAQRVSSVVLGNPAGNAAIIVDAVEAITKMLIASLNEDDFGKAVQTVPGAVKQFTRTVMMVESYVGTSIQGFSAAEAKEVEEITVVVARMKAALRELLAAFQVFLNDAGLGIKDLNEARRASEERPLIPEKKTSNVDNKIPEMEDAGKQQRQLGSQAEKPDQEDPRAERARETARSLRRMESQPRRQRISGNDGNVFGARDFDSAGIRRSREVGMVK